MNENVDSLLQAPTYRKRLYGFDILRFLAAVCVISLHTGYISFPSVEPSFFMEPIRRLTITFAVPVFFSITGFFAVGTDFSYEKAEKDLLDSFKKYAREYAIWVAVYYPITIAEFIKKDFTLSHAVLTTLRGVFFRGTLFYSWQLWYLLCCAYSLLFLYLMMKWRVDLRLLTAISAALFLLGNIFTELIATNEAVAGTLIARIFESGRLLTGVMFIWFGISIRYYRGSVDSKKSLLGILIGFLLVWSFYDSSYILRGVGSAVLTVSLFCFVVPLRLKPRASYLFLSEMSRAIYYLNMFIAWPCLLLFPQTDGWKRFGVIFALTLLIAAVYAFYKLRRKAKKYIRKGD